ncbi:MAG: acetylornithine deacetylase or succinyl-diaminopimelate desuccinylase [Candidatus Levybacteria bacterium]|nr:acetylornithine deacetylase or succinyl-diaminopimelate desuccinylase [Candidatus Levybacteria bacterium]
MNTLLELTEELISIPSYVGDNCNEKKIADFIAEYLRKRNFKVKKQLIASDRYNIIATFGSPRLWLCGHIDTVEPKSPEQLIPEIIDGKIYGLGSVDMKGGIAAILTAINLVEAGSNIGLLFYCDEEYSFAGMRKFLKSFRERPSLVLIAEPTNLGISNAHRGLVELNAVVKGKSGHASRPEEGINAITETVKAISKFSEIINNDYSSTEAGITTCTLSSIKGGTQIGKNGRQIIYSKNTNSIPDTVEICLDIRPAKINLRGPQVKKLLIKNFDQKGLRLKSIEIKQDFGPLLTPKKSLRTLENILSGELGSCFYLPSQKMGYGDGQLFFEKTKSPVAYLGPGPTEACHKENECVDISSLEKIMLVYKRLIEEYSREE